MALGGLLLLLQVGIIRAWKERSTLGRGEGNGRRNRDHAKESLETRQVRDPAIEEVRRTAKSSSAKSSSKPLFNSRPEKYPCQNYSRLISLEHPARLASYVLPFVKSLKRNESSAQHLQHPEYPRHSPVPTHSRNTATVSR
jgi:hypothetical protein